MGTSSVCLYKYKTKSTPLYCSTESPPSFLRQAGGKFYLNYDKTGKIIVCLFTLKLSQS